MTFVMATNREMGKLEDDARSRRFYLRWEILRYVSMSEVIHVEREKVLMQERKGVIAVGKSLSWEGIRYGEKCRA